MDRTIFYGRRPTFYPSCISERARSKLCRSLAKLVTGAKLGKADIVQKLEERGGPEARKLFERFMRDVEKLQAEQEHKDG